MTSIEPRHDPHRAIGLERALPATVNGALYWRRTNQPIGQNRKVSSSTPMLAAAPALIQAEDWPPGTRSNTMKGDMKSQLQRTTLPSTTLAAIAHGRSSRARHTGRSRPIPRTPVQAVQAGDHQLALRPHRHRGLALKYSALSDRKSVERRLLSHRPAIAFACSAAVLSSTFAVEAGFTAGK
jgi:hypothetical protein